MCRASALVFSRDGPATFTCVGLIHMQDAKRTKRQLKKKSADSVGGATVTAEHAELERKAKEVSQTKSSMVMPPYTLATGRVLYTITVAQHILTWVQQPHTVVM